MSARWSGACRTVRYLKSGLKGPPAMSHCWYLHDSIRACDAWPPRTIQAWMSTLAESSLQNIKTINTSLEYTVIARGDASKERARARQRGRFEREGERERGPFKRAREREWSFRQREREREIERSKVCACERLCERICNVREVAAPSDRMGRVREEREIER